MVEKKAQAMIYACISSAFCMVKNFFIDTVFLKFKIAGSDQTPLS